MKTMFHTVLALHMPKKHGDFILYANHIVDSMSNNPHFPNPTPPLATVTAHIKALEDAETAAKTRAKGAADARNLDLQQVATDLHQLALYVQTVADATPAEAVAIITSAGFGTHPHGVHAKPELVAVMGPGGLVQLRAHAVGRRAAYEWQVSNDGGKTWTTLPATTTAHTSVAGLTLGATYAFRFRGNVGDKPGDWSELTTIIVH